MKKFFFFSFSKIRFQCDEAQKKKKIKIKMRFNDNFSDFVNYRKFNLPQEVDQICIFFKNALHSKLIQNVRSAMIHNVIAIAPQREQRCER